MEAAIRPEPSPNERVAIEVALRKVIKQPGPPAVYTSAWREAGLREAVAAQAVARPRTSFGATRA